MMRTFKPALAVVFVRKVVSLHRSARQELTNQMRVKPLALSATTEAIVLQLAQPTAQLVPTIESAQGPDSPQPQSAVLDPTGKPRQTNARVALKVNSVGLVEGQ